MPSRKQVLVIDVGGTNVKFRASGVRCRRSFPSGKDLTPAQLVRAVVKATRDWKYDVVALGYPGVVNEHGPAIEPKNLGSGWVGFDFSAAFGKPVRVMNDAAMQALGSYEGGRMLFLGLGTGLGSTLISGKVIVPLEIGRLPFDGEHNLEDALSKQGLVRLGLERWREAFGQIAGLLKEGFIADYLVAGGGQAKHLGTVPSYVRLGANENAFVGGFRLWSEEVTSRQHAANGAVQAEEWHLI